VKRWTIDVVLVGCLMMAGAFGVRAYVEQVIKEGARPSFYQGEFGAAVMAACGRGFVNPALAASSPMFDFLAVRSDRFARRCPPISPLPR
jgi:hypothetical protein